MERTLKRAAFMANVQLAGICGLLFAGMAAAQQAVNYPTRPIRLVVGVTAGGGIDVIARIVTAPLAEALGQQIVIDNRPGAGSTIAAALVAHAAPDGHTLLMGTISTHGINPALRRKLPYDHIKEFAPVSLLATVANVLVVHPSVPANNLAEFVAFAKSNPGKVLFGSSGVGSSMHLSMELLKATTATNMVHIPYKGSAIFMPDLMSAKIQAICSNVPSMTPHIRAGKVRALAVTSPVRNPRLPSVPTFFESGVNVEVLVWYAFFAPAALPKPILARLNAETVTALNLPETTRRLNEQGYDVRPSTPEELAAWVRVETKRWRDAVRFSGATASD